MGRNRIFTAVMVVVAAAGFAQSQDFNAYYQFPFSVGFEYQTLNPFSEYGATFQVYELAGEARVPLPFAPTFQPMVRAGMITFDGQDLAEPLKWDHFHVFAGLGMGYAYRFEKSFEVGAEAGISYSLAYFSDLIPGETVGYGNLIFEAGVRISLDPAYSFTLNAHPNLRYILPLGVLKDFQGLSMGIGFSASYRFGEDPDSPAAIIRSLRFVSGDTPPVFASMHGYYSANPFTTIEITNTERFDVTDLEFSFFQAGFMDSPTPGVKIDVLPAGETVEVPLYALFNKEIFTIEGSTPLTGEVVVTYSSRGRPVEQRAGLTYELYDKSSITWDDDAKLAALITPSDSALKNYVSFVRQAAKEETLPAFSDALQFAIQVFHGLGEIGLLYQVDPTLPFTEVQDNPLVVDTVSLPRDTLKRITGDCDDLTVLYASLMEISGAETGFITVPGHVYAAFNTGLEARDFAKAHPDRSMTIIMDGEVWVPVEITMIGKGDFMDAWRTGAEEWYRYESNPADRDFIRTRKSQETYKPVSLTERDLGLQYGDPAAIIRGFRSDLGSLVDNTVSEYRGAAESGGRKQDYNRLGIVYAQFKRYREAEAAFRKALQIDGDYVSARTNLGNLRFVDGDFSGALQAFEAAYGVLEGSGRETSSSGAKLLINISRAQYRLEQFGEAGNSFARAREIDPATADEYEYLASAGGGGEARASEARDPALEILYLED